MRIHDDSLLLLFLFGRSIVLFGTFVDKLYQASMVKISPIQTRAGSEKSGIFRLVWIKEL